MWDSNGIPPALYPVSVGTDGAQWQCASGGKIYQCKGNGLASKVFRDDGSRVADLPGYMGIGHLRYPTAGTSASAEAQPFYVNSPYGICFSASGNLINATDLKHFLDFEAHRHINTDSDSELMLNIFANELNETGKARVNDKDIVDALGRIPSDAGEGTDYMMASESVALKQLGFEDFADIMPGQAVIIRKGTAPVFYQIQEQKRYAPDIFEFCYFARPDSIIDGISVNQSRENMGTRLGRKIKATIGEKAVREIDVIIPIPETSTTSVPFVAQILKRPYHQGFVKNRYVFRTFIMPGQTARQKGVKRKLNAMDQKFAGKNVLLIDDSIVRGTTSREIVGMAREAGAKKVYFASCAPPVTHAHIYGIDLASPNELIAHARGHDRTIEEIAKDIGADEVIFQDLEDLKAACSDADILRPEAEKLKDFEVGVFCGNYVTPVDAEYFKHLEEVRGESMKMKVLEKARGAIANGTSSKDVLEVATNGLKGLESGKPVASSDHAGAKSAPHINGNGDRRRPSNSEETTPRDRMDISLHNFGDF
ncbi:hypothetical protein Q9189_005899 [Teloschistes chrysophthalmus]